MELLIAEKPAMALDIARALGNDVVRRDGYFEVAGKVVSYAIGHLIGLEEPQGYVTVGANTRPLWSLAAQTMATCAPHGELVTIANNNHDAIVRQPAAFSRALLDFLARH